MRGATAVTVLCGVVLGAGLWLSLVRLPAMRAIRFVERIEPQLRTQNVQSRLLATVALNVTPFGPLERILRPVIHDVVRSISRMNLGNAALARRLSRAGSAHSPLDFRAEQLFWAAAGFVVAVVLVIASALGGRLSPVLAVVAIFGSAVGGFLLRDYVLSQKIRKREARMLAEFPSLAELMALAVGAGESAAGALERVCRTARGELAKEFAQVLADRRAGKPLVEALQGFAGRTDVAPLARFVDGIVVAVERGTPLADVLRAQAQDVRDVAKRELMESAGRKEIAMMIPLVFGVLPLSIIFAAFPGVAALQIGL
ncbi:type II secretion system F family protein [Arthrobacter sp. M4]|uniref:type II secretion system F family protein n=1 Tax=Arthrobacter sp. M4 TaxID=218160 RepID=UPI001CDD1200|nr:type II secretion system F family protein [Arthrobacter sp. M4]MCA4132239.1 type II secretion system F family protein [Arthrobacter sp. M4]